MSDYSFSSLVLHVRKIVRFARISPKRFCINRYHRCCVCWRMVRRLSWNSNY